MIDKNGVSMVTGDIVRIENAYFKSDCGYWFITYSPGDPAWSSHSFHGLQKIGKYGKICKSNKSGVWPLMAFTNNKQKNEESNNFNESHATIEVIKGVDTSDIIAYFMEESEKNKRLAEKKLSYWQASDIIPMKYKEIADFYTGVVKRLCQT